MKEPEITQEGQDYAFRYELEPQQGEVVVRVSKLVEHTDGYTGLFVLHATDVLRKDGSGPYPTGKVFGPSKVTLASSRSKESTAKMCRERIPEVDWLAVIESVCETLTEMVEAGSPIEDLGGDSSVEMDRPFLFPPILRYENTLLYGMGGSHKSMLALAFAACLSEGKNLIGGQDCPSLRTAYLDFEDESDTARTRLELMREAWCLKERPHVLYKRADSSLPAMVDSFSRQIARAKIEYLVIDSAALACPDAEKSEGANQFFRSLRKLGVKGTLIIGHQTKTEEKFPFGSVFWWNGPRSIWFIKNVRADEEKEVHVGLFHRKSNNGMLQPPVGYKVKIEPGQWIDITNEQITQVDEFRGELRLPQRIQAVLADHTGLRRDELRALLKEIDSTTKDDTIRKAVDRMLDKGYLAERAGILYRIAREYQERD